MTTGDGAEAAFAELFDELLQQLLEKGEPDLEQLRRDHPAAAARIPEALAMAGGVAGRREPSTPTFGGYQIVRELGRGGMGTVYLARHDALDREVALKVLPTSLGLSQRSRRRFHEEARALARLQHEHIVRIHRVVEHGDLLAFEMEYVDGASLRQCIDRLRASGGEPGLADLGALLGGERATVGARTLVDYFVRVGIQLARALHAAHSTGVVHRDVKPANVLLRRDGRAVLADFGLALGPDLDRSRRGDFVGTPTYASPEQLRGGDDAVDARADVYSLGVTLYEAIALAPPIHGRSTTDLLRRIEDGVQVPLRRRNPRVSRDLETILHKAMEREPKQRYQSAAELADDLERLLHLQPIHARPVNVWRRASKFVRRNARTLVAASLGAVLVAAAMVPIVDRVASAESRREAVLGSIARARLDLLRSCCAQDWQLFALAQGARFRRVEDDPAAVDGVAHALAAYGSALAAGIDDPVVRRERDVVRLVSWLRSDSPARLEQVDAARQSRAFAEVTAPLSPPLQAAAEGLLAGGAAKLPVEVATASRADQQALGLLYFLLGEYALAEQVWSVDPALANDAPLVDVGLGMLYLADGRASRAYLRLLRGARAMPDAPELELLLADAALEMGDADLASQWSARLDAARLPRPLRRHADLLAGDLANARGAVAEARATYQRLAAEAPTDPLPRYRLAQLRAAAGDVAGARTLLADLLVDWPEVVRFRLDLARAALQLDDVALYLEQARFAVLAAQTNGRSAGSLGDLQQILRLGGLDPLAGEPALRGTQRPLGEALALRRPIAARLPSWCGSQLDDLVRRAAEFERDLRRIDAALLPTVTRWLAAVAAAAAHAPGSLALASPCARVALGAALLAYGGQSAIELETRVRVELLLLERRLGFVPATQLLAVFEGETGLNIAAASAVMPDVDGDGVADFAIASATVDVAKAPGRAELFAATGRGLARFAGDDPTRMFGMSIAAPGDLDGDGVGDVLVGAPLGVHDRPGSGAAYVFSGATGQRLRTLTSPAAGFGVSVAGIGDWDGDGRPDCAVGIAPELRNRAALGQAQVFSGRDGALLATLAGDRAGFWFGAFVGGVGDVDGDGRADLAVAGNFGNAPGMVRIYAGGTGAVLHTWIDDALESGFGEVVAAAGDLDRDGCGDLWIAAPGAPQHALGGRVIALSGRDGRTLAILRAGKPGDRFGLSLCGGTDFDGDGIPDVVVGSRRGGAADGGSIRLYSGRTGAVLDCVDNRLPLMNYATSLGVLSRRDGPPLVLVVTSDPRNFSSAFTWSPALPAAAQPR